MGLGAAPLLSARPGFLSSALVSRRGLVSFCGGVGLRTSSSSGNFKGAAELDAPGGNGNDSLLEAAEGGDGYRNTDCLSDGLGL
jgi:hypothetical protein